MTDTLDATPAAPRPHLGASAQAARRTLAIEWARSIIDAPADAVTVADYRHVILVLTGELARLDQQHRNLAGVNRARQVLDTVRLCPGSGEYVSADVTDGAGVTACPRCHLYRTTTPGDEAGQWRRIERHRDRP